MKAYYVWEQREALQPLKLQSGAVSASLRFPSQPVEGWNIAVDSGILARGKATVQVCVCGPTSPSVGCHSCVCHIYIVHTYAPV